MQHRNDYLTPMRRPRRRPCTREPWASCRHGHKTSLPASSNNRGLANTTITAQQQGKTNASGSTALIGHDAGPTMGKSATLTTLDANRASPRSKNSRPWILKSQRSRLWPIVVTSGDEARQGASDKQQSSRQGVPLVAASDHHAQCMDDDQGRVLTKRARCI